MSKTAILAVIACAWGAALPTVALAEPVTTPPSCPYIGEAAVPLMPADRFWDLIAASQSSANDLDAQVEALSGSLLALTPDEIESFEASYNQAMDRANDWKLWGAIYVVDGGASDDGFEYFRSWLISRGRHVYEAVLADPDSLGAYIPRRADEPVEFEDFAYVAGDAWGQKVGRAIDDPVHPFRSCRGAMAKPTGVAFSQEPASLAQAYPRLWKRFGDHPLG